MAARSISTAARSGDRRATLEALRDLIAKQLATCESGRDVAALSKRLMEVMGELDALPDPKAEKNPAQLARERARSRAS